MRVVIGRLVSQVQVAILLLVLLPLALVIRLLVSADHKSRAEGRRVIWAARLVGWNSIDAVRGHLLLLVCLVGVVADWHIVVADIIAH